MATSKPVQCGPCQKGNDNTEADIWCYNCDEGLCSTCSGHHKRFNGTLNHKTISIKNYKPSTKTINLKTECDKHGQQLNLYCPSHLMPCCDECISTSHSKCTGIKSLANIIENTKIEKCKESVEEDINSILDLLNQMVNNKTTNIQTGEQKCEGIKKSMIKIRQTINKHLDKLEEKLCQEIDRLWNWEKSAAIDFISELEEKRKNLKEIRQHLHAVVTHTPKLQSFLGVHQIEQQVHQCQRYIEDLEDDERTKEVDIKMNQNDELEKMLSQLEQMESFGKVMVDKTEITLKRDTSGRTDPQVKSREKSNINNMTMNIETKIEINIKGMISDMICLIDGRVIVVEWRGKLHLFTSSGIFQKQLPMPDEAYSVAQINNNTISVLFPEHTAIRIFNMEKETVIKFIKLNTLKNSIAHFMGLSFSNNSLAVGYGYCHIVIIDLKENIQKVIKVNELNVCDDIRSLVYCNDRIIYSDWDSRAVNCVDESGELIWQYAQDLSGPTKLCSDTYGNIIVIDKDRIIVVSKDGQDSKVLISGRDSHDSKELNGDLFICFKRNESSGFICNSFGNYLKKINVSLR
ncbi:unnamed protein product [Mytilus edulis]|uniref:B box-type domain-containing protein n=1 Tax=Mytilus edulis TaxID=6550 RepID=A0A8S3SWR7_MYTED|nr:unnamed protein product [Mytilus edulis]